MTAYQYEEFKLLCDAPACRSRFGPKPAKRGEVRRMARKAGWATVLEPGLPVGSTRDFCPGHQPEVRKVVKPEPEQEAAPLASLADALKASLAAAFPDHKPEPEEG